MPIGGEVAIGLPEWTEFTRKTGLDPLGMQNSSVRHYQSLVPGISNVTLRVRYYGFYAWLSDAYAKTVGETSMRTWQRFIRRAEALYALIAQAGQGESGVAGANWASKKVQESRGRSIRFGEDADPGSPTHYLKQAWGAYGAAYASQLFEIGIFSRSASHAVPVPSKELGEDLARVFGESIGDLGRRFLEAMERGSVTHDELEMFSSMAPSEIGRNSKERNLYQRILFADAGLDRSQDLERKRTLLLVLGIAGALQREPNVGDVRWCLYSSYLDGNRHAVGSELEGQRNRWRLYQANDLSHVAFSAILKFLLDRLEAYPAGVTMDALIAEAASDVIDAMGEKPTNWATFARGITFPADASCESDSNSELALSDLLMGAMQRGAFFEPQMCVVALKLLAVLQNRMEPHGCLLDDEFGGLDTEGFKSILTELRFLKANGELSFRDHLRKVFEERVLRRHLWVALRKLRFQNDYTFLIDSDEGLVRLRQKDGPAWTTPRLGPSITFLKDIGLIGPEGLTKRGLSLWESAA